MHLKVALVYPVLSQHYYTDYMNNMDYLHEAFMD